MYFWYQIRKKKSCNDIAEESIHKNKSLKFFAIESQK